MKRFFLYLLFGFMVFSCKSKKEIVTKTNKSDTEKVVTKKNSPNKNTPTTPNTYKNPPVSAKSYASDTERYIDMYKDFAQVEMKLYEVPASITLAQGILESASGNGRLSVEANNHFGIKCGDWTGNKIYHDDDEKQECFRKYSEPKYSFRDHSLFIAQRDRYSKLFQLKKEDYKGWAKGLQAAGYATDKKYPQKLISLIELYELYKYDQAVLEDTFQESKPSVAVKNEIDQLKVIEKETPTQNTVQVKPSVSVGTGAYIVSKGDTLYSIAIKHNMTVKELQSMNGISDTYISLGQKLAVNALPGASGSARAVYKVVKGDTLYSISKKHNVTVKELQNLNGLKDNTISIGQVLVVKLGSKN
ncbi:MAG: glucosaminidase domain-containing protein [Flavobacteriaceae bacterium]|tara:strand:+ start:3844 stop:4923 length:1080 start_codon:yes stop_codon:yes gene_type:complete